MLFLYCALLYCMMFNRYIFGMAFAETRVEKKGKTVLTITEGVRRLINGLQAFEERLEKAQENKKD